MKRALTHYHWNNKNGQGLKYIVPLKYYIKIKCGIALLYIFLKSNRFSNKCNKQNIYRHLEYLFIHKLYILLSEIYDIISIIYITIN